MIRNIRHDGTSATVAHDTVDDVDTPDPPREEHKELDSGDIDGPISGAGKRDIAAWSITEEGHLRSNMVGERMQDLWPAHLTCSSQRSRHFNPRYSPTRQFRFFAHLQRRNVGLRILGCRLNGQRLLE